MPAQATKPPLSAATGELGRRVRELRLELEMSQEELAEASDLHWSYIGQVERGQNNLTLHSLLRFAQALEVDPSVLVEQLPKIEQELRPRRVRRRLRRTGD